MSPFLLKRLSDESLGSRLASGEAAAFDELYRRYIHRLAAYGAHLLGDATSGDDVAQAALLKAYGALRAGKRPDRLRPWLFRIAHNAAIDVVARRRELPAAELPDRPAADGAQDAGALVAALAALPERQRRVYVLRELHGLRIDETAAELGMSLPQVEQALFAARNRMAEHLVFGHRLNCVAVQRLAAGSLDLDERRALKTHLRSCPDCRRAVGTRMPGLAGVPLAPVDWLRGLGGLAGGGAPLAAKVGAVVATATLAAGVPVAIETAHVHLHARSHHAPRHRDVVSATAAAEPVRSAAPIVLVGHRSTWTVTHDSTPVPVSHRVTPRDEEPAGSTSTRSDDGTGDNRTGDGGGSGAGSSGDSGDRPGTGGTTTEPMDDSSADGGTTQTETTQGTSSGDGGTTSDGGDTTTTGDSGASDGGTSSSGSSDAGTGADGGSSSHDGGSGGDGTTQPPAPGSGD